MSENRNLYIWPYRIFDLAAATFKTGRFISLSMKHYQILTESLKLPFRNARSCPTYRKTGLIFVVLLVPFLSVAQQLKSVDFKSCDADISIDFSRRTVTGRCEYEFDVLSMLDTIKIDAVNMTFSDLTINRKGAGYTVSAKSLNLFKGFKKGHNKISFSYTATPKQAMYFVGQDAGAQIWTQGQGKDTSNWLPSFNDVNEKVTFALTIAFDKDFDVISNGTLKNKKTDGRLNSWSYQMKRPISSYLVMLAIGKFAKRVEMSASGIPLEQYVSAGDEAKVEPTYRNSAKIFDYLEKEIGVAYPWEIYKQIPAKDFLYGGMENASATIFASDYVVDSTGYNDKNYLNVNAHELAHQWFGDLVTAKSGKHHWLQEGFATYYALLAERSVFGDDYFYAKLYDMAEELQRAQKYDTVPILNEKASSATFYKKGAWALHVLRENIGAENFRKAVKSYLEKYAFKTADTDAFLAEVRKYSDYDLDGFKKRWLESGTFETAECIGLLKKNPAIRALFAIAESRAGAEPKEMMEKWIGVMRSDVYFTVKQDILYQTAAIPFDEKQDLIRAALATNDLKVRQAVAQTIGKFPESFYAEFSALLDDRSYITQEVATAIAWKLFPEKHKELLDKTDGRIGFNDKNLRIQWLTLALTEKEYRPAEKVHYYDELLSYATPLYESSVRQNALENLIFIGPNDKNAMKLLVNPLVHHKWQFAKFAREKIRALMKFIAPRVFFEKLLPELPENEKAQLQKLVSESQE